MGHGHGYDRFLISRYKGSEIQCYDRDFLLLQLLFYFMESEKIISAVKKMLKIDKFPTRNQYIGGEIESEDEQKEYEK